MSFFGYGGFDGRTSRGGLGGSIGTGLGDYGRAGAERGEEPVSEESIQWFISLGYDERVVRRLAGLSKSQRERLFDEVERQPWFEPTPSWLMVKELRERERRGLMAGSLFERGNHATGSVMGNRPYAGMESTYDELVRRLMSSDSSGRSRGAANIMSQFGARSRGGLGGDDLGDIPMDNRTGDEALRALTQRGSRGGFAPRHGSSFRHQGRGGF